jgi:hypothetical protein
MAKDGRGPPILVVSPSRPGRSGFTLHRTGRMAMLHGLRGRIPHGLRTSFYIRPRIRPEKLTTLLSGLSCSAQILTPQARPSLPSP